MGARNLGLLALRLLWREWRAGELRILLAALLIAVLVSSSISLFSDRLQRGMLQQAAEFVGADMLISGRAPLPEEWRRQAAQMQLESTLVVEFASMLASDTDMLLASVRAVDQGYPLRGEVRLSQQLLGDEQTAEGIPEPGSLWAEARLLQRLDSLPGERLELGLLQPQVSAVLTHEPDRAGDFYSLNPRVLMNLADLEASGLIQPGSRVRYRLLLAGAEADLLRYRQWLEPQLQAGQRITAVQDDNRQIGGALERATRFLGLASIAAVVLAGVAVALSAQRFASRHFDSSALLRCFGLQRRQVLWLFLLQLLAVGLIATLLGLLLGLLTQTVLVALLADLLPRQLPAPAFSALGMGAATGLITLFGFALPPLLQLGRVAPLRVLRRDMLPLPASGWLIHGLALGSLALLLWQFTGDAGITLAVLLGGVSSSLLLGLLAWLLLRSIGQRLRHASLAWRLGAGQLLRDPAGAAGQILAFGLILMAMTLILMLRTELLDNWQAQLPEDTPNHFALNIQPAEAESFSQRLSELGASLAPLYPITPARLELINDEPALQRAEPGSQPERAINRDLSVTWSAELPADNRLLAGNWWSAAETRPKVSVEARLAENLGIALGDRLSFQIAGQRLDAEVSSLREVNWDNFTPNFFMIFSPGSLDNYPQSMLTSFRLDPQDQQALLELRRAFPAVTLLEVEAILQQVRDILAQVTIAVEFVLLFVLLAGFSVLFAALQSSLDQRLHEGALLRTLGAGRQLLRRSHRREFGLLGALAGLLAIAGAELASWILYRQVLDMPWQPHWLLWLLLPLAGALLIALAGSLGTRAVVQRSPLHILRQGDNQ